MMLAGGIMYINKNTLINNSKISIAVLHVELEKDAVHIKRITNGLSKKQIFPQ